MMIMMTMLVMILMMMAVFILVRNFALILCQFARPCFFKTIQAYQKINLKKSFLSHGFQKQKESVSEKAELKEESRLDLKSAVQRRCIEMVLTSQFSIMQVQTFLKPELSLPKIRFLQQSFVPSYSIFVHTFGIYFFRLWHSHF